MPSLKDLSCCIQIDGTKETLPEYGTEYADGLVETFIPVPSEPKPFAVYMTTSAFIAEGLAMYVFIDGVYQCNRIKQGFRLPRKDDKPGYRVITDFHAYQKEEKRPDGKYYARPWTFAKINVASEDETSALPPEQLDKIGCIEVVVVRCGNRDRNGHGPVETSLFFDGTEDQEVVGLGINLDGASDSPDLSKCLDGGFDDDPDYIRRRHYPGHAHDRDDRHHNRLPDRTHRRHRESSIRPRDSAYYHPPLRRAPDHPSLRAHNGNYRTGPDGQGRNHGDGQYYERYRQQNRGYRLPHYGPHFFDDSRQHPEPEVSEFTDDFTTSSTTSFQASGLNTGEHWVKYGDGPIATSSDADTDKDKFRNRPPGPVNSSEPLVAGEWLPEMLNDARRQGYREARQKARRKQAEREKMHAEYAESQWQYHAHTVPDAWSFPPPPESEQAQNAPRQPPPGDSITTPSADCGTDADPPSPAFSKLQSNSSMCPGQGSVANESVEWHPVGNAASKRIAKQGHVPKNHADYQTDKQEQVSNAPYECASSRRPPTPAGIRKARSQHQNSYPYSAFASAKQYVWRHSGAPANDDVTSKNPWETASYVSKTTDKEHGQSPDTPRNSPRFKEDSAELRWNSSRGVDAGWGKRSPKTAPKKAPQPENKTASSWGTNSHIGATGEEYKPDKASPLEKDVSSWGTNSHVGKTWDDSESEKGSSGGWASEKNKGKLTTWKNSKLSGQAKTPVVIPSVPPVPARPFIPNMCDAWDAAIETKEDKANDSDSWDATDTGDNDNEWNAGDQNDNKPSSWNTGTNDFGQKNPNNDWGAGGFGDSNNDPGQDASSDNKQWGADNGWNSNSFGNTSHEQAENNDWSVPDFNDTDNQQATAPWETANEDPNAVQQDENKAPVTANTGRLRNARRLPEVVKDQKNKFQFPPPAVDKSAVEDAPLYTIPATKAAEEGIEHQVQAGPGRKYAKAVRRPKYQDDLDRPYAIFRFKYRSWKVLRELLGDEVPEEPGLKSMSREELEAEVLKLRGSKADG